MPWRQVDPMTERLRFVRDARWSPTNASSGKCERVMTLSAPSNGLHFSCGGADAVSAPSPAANAC